MTRSGSLALEPLPTRVCGCSRQWRKPLAEFSASNQSVAQRQMQYQISSGTIEALKATLAQIEQTPELALNDPSLLMLKSILLQRIAELQAVGEAAAQQAERAVLDAALTPFHRSRWR